MSRYLLLLLTALTTSALSAQVTEQDSLALVALYNATGGDNWTDNSGWLDGPVSSWYGITTSGDRVLRILLTNNNLTGNLPDEIGDLDALTHLRIYTNAFEGPLPAAIGNMTSLTYLDIHLSGFSGTLPEELVNCTELVAVIAYRNELSGPFPEVLLRLPLIERIELGSNAFTGPLPAAIDTLSNMRKFAIEDNQFAGPMPSIRNLTALSEVHIRENALEGDMDTILGYHPEMYYFTLNNNLFTGCVPETAFNPENLQYLHLQNNALECLGDFSVFADTGVIQRLYCGNNAMTFDFLEPNTGIGIYEYAPQDSLLERESHILKEGDTITMDAGTGGMYTHYTWFKDGAEIPGQNARTLHIPDFQEADAGTYHCMATNDSLPELTLYRHQVQVMMEGTSALTQVPIRKLEIYPNPASDVVSLTGLDGPGIIEIMDIAGHIMVRESADLSAPCDVRGLSQGVYSLRVEAAGGQYVGKFIKL